MWEAGAATSKAPFQIRSVRQIRDDLAIASVNFGVVTAHSIWVLDLAGQPHISWPKSNRGFPAVTVEEGIREQVETAILDVVAGWRHA